jgi:hypothetical protein
MTRPRAILLALAVAACEDATAPEGEFGGGRQIQHRFVLENVNVAADEMFLRCNGAFAIQRQEGRSIFGAFRIDEGLSCSRSVTGSLEGTLGEDGAVVYEIEVDRDRLSENLQGCAIDGGIPAFRGRIGPALNATMEAGIVCPDDANRLFWQMEEIR